MTCENRSTSMKRSTCTVGPGRRARGRCGRGRRASRARPCPSPRRAAARLRRRRASSCRRSDRGSRGRPRRRRAAPGEEPTSAISSELEQEQVRRRIDAPQRPVDLERRRRRRPHRPLRGHDLERIAGADVLHRDAHHLLVALSRGEALDRRPPQQRCRSRTGLGLEQRRSSSGSPASTSAMPGTVVEADEGVHDDEPALRKGGPAVGSGTVGSSRRHGRRRDTRPAASPRPSASSNVTMREPAPIHEFRPSRPRSTDSSRKLARPAWRSLRYAPSGVSRSVGMVVRSVSCPETKRPPCRRSRASRAVAAR